MQHTIRQYGLEQGALEIQFIEEMFSEFSTHKTADDIITRRIDLTSGSLALPEGPGLGVTLDDEKVAKYRLDLKAAA